MSHWRWPIFKGRGFTQCFTSYLFLLLVKYLHHSLEFPKAFHLITMSGWGSGSGFYHLSQIQRQIRLWMWFPKYSSENLWAEKWSFPFPLMLKWWDRITIDPPIQKEKTGGTQTLLLCCCCSAAKLCPTLCDPWTAALQASLSFTIFQSFLKLMSFESMMPSNHLILCRPLLLLSIFPSMRVFSSELAVHIRLAKGWSFSISPSNEYSRLISFRIDWFDLPACPTDSQQSSPAPVWKH